MVVFCAYCGKSFTRKEHLERHIPSHTNVKPHRCSACQLSFARRDLLQRHHSTYHEARDPMEPLPGGVPTVAGRTPIACQNCASAKTGCDKRVPCSRCAEKNLPCAARFARRSSKAAVRAAQANAAAAFTAQMVPSPPQQNGPSMTPPFIDLEAANVKPDSPIRSPLGLDQMMVGSAAGLDMCLPDGMQASHLQLHHSPYAPHQQAHAHAHPHSHAHQPKQSPPHTHTHLSPEDFSSPHGRMEPLDEFMGYAGGGDYLHHGTGYQDLMWTTDYPMDMDIYTSSLHMAPPGDLAAGIVQPFAATADLSDIASNSEPMTVSSSRGSVHTRGTSIFSTGDPESMTASATMPSSSRSSVSNSAAVDGGSSASAFKAAHNGLLDVAVIVPTAEDTIPEFPVVVASEAAWPLARCNPPIFSASCPRTAIVHLECLEQKSKQEGTWRTLEQYLDSQPDAVDAPQVVPLTSRSREKMLAITQGFLHKALDIHRSGLYPKNGAAGASSPVVDFNFLVLPPSRILEYFLRSYVHSLAIYYPLVVGGVVDPNEMLDNNQASTLLVLLMIAQGAASVPMPEARYLSAGLSETCRISLFDIIEKNVEMSADPLALRCALLFTLLGAWGGDKWHMDIAMGQRSMYLSMLKHAGMLEAQPSMVPNFSSPTNAELQWRSWLHREGQNRLVYNWVMVDQELSLFHDTAPVLSISDLQCPLPSPDVLWLSPTAERWLVTAQSIYGCTLAQANPQAMVSPSLTPSLCEVFQDFLHDNLARRKSSLTPQLLRLLLHPLQSLLCHLRQMLSCLSDVVPVRRTSNRTVTKASTLQRLEEVQAQLQQWYELSIAFFKANPTCPVTRCNLVLYHLISLNAVANFPEIERLARGGFDPAAPCSAAATAAAAAAAASAAASTPSASAHSSPPAAAAAYWKPGPTVSPSVRHKSCIFQREEAVFHCGQVLRLLRQMEPDRRPSWWSAALYRAVLILWADSICRPEPSFKQQQQSEASLAAAAVVVATAGPCTVANGSAAASASSSPLARKTAPPTLPTSSVGGSSRTAGAHGPASSLVAIDQVTPEDECVITYLWGGEGTEGVAVLTHSDGTHFTLDKPNDILDYGVKRIGEAMSTRISDGIRRKLLGLASRWAGETLM